ncbi:hypothetical protein SAMN04487857_10797 [Pseudomonas sp. ok272]|uniref:hypothetical protein n=1 Tax=unclassified Pseudomonas TaxID=196821 RepID=UPI0008D1A32E|nr:MULTISPECIES: hypothetical protein [unclassified Pseudomonas]SEM93372.1 hypothetical protein SAMN04487857_10797 [Pseudomonas sp. ok272]SFM94908.1 hypothetical protein SAMN04487858_109119 [Pseudomonas sp. ok602]
MSTNRQKSFIATLQIDNAHVQSLGVLHGVPALRTETSFSGGWFTGAKRTKDDSHLLGCRPIDEVNNTTPWTIYFRCTNDYYILYIRTHETYTGLCISKDSQGMLGALDPDENDITSFNILNLNNRIITLQDMPRGVHYVRLKARNSERIGSIRRNGAPYNYFCETPYAGQVFKSTILERNASYISNPDEV